MVAAVVLAVIAVSCGGGDGDPVEVAGAGTTTDESIEATIGGATAETADDGTTEDPIVDDDPVSAPSGFEGQLTVVVPNSPGTLSVNGSQRVMTALVGDGPNAFLGSPAQPVSVRFDPVDGEGAGEVEGTWLTTNASSLGLYVAYFDFASPGLWEITVVAEGQDLGTALVEVVEDSTVPNIGDPAPPSLTATGTTPEEIAAISTDPEPDPALYDLTIADAVGNGRPTVVAFATPAFCQTALCGPTLGMVKAATEGRADIDVVHVEPFDLELAPGGTFEPVPTMAEWGLVTEPWVFVVDADGLVAATFEGIMGQPELEAAIDRLQR
ncbi:MAG: hypothetical protein WBM50_21670 [Acidimicrobiales bacterium]